MTTTTTTTTTMTDDDDDSDDDDREEAATAIAGAGVRGVDRPPDRRVRQPTTTDPA